MAHRRSSSRFLGGLRSHFGTKSTSNPFGSGSLIASYSSPEVSLLRYNVIPSRTIVQDSFETFSNPSTSTSHSTISGSSSSSFEPSTSLSSGKLLNGGDSTGEIPASLRYSSWSYNHMDDQTLPPSPFEYLKKGPKFRFLNFWDTLTRSFYSLLPHTLWEKIILIAFLAYLTIFLRALIGQGGSLHQANCRDILIGLEGNYTQPATIKALPAFVNTGTLEPNGTAASRQPEVVPKTNETLAGNYQFVEQVLSGEIIPIPTSANTSGASEKYETARDSADPTRADVN